MSFEVRTFEAEDRKGECLWKFQLGKNSVSQVDFYIQEESVRSLFHLAQDINHQIETITDKKKKKSAPKDRVIRKLCEKMIKSLGVSLKCFAQDIEESAESVKSYFWKKELTQEARKRIEKKCQKWIIEAWMSLPSEMFFKSSKKYLQSLFNDGKKVSPDFQLLNQFYLIVEGDNFDPLETQQSSKSEKLVLIDINLNVNDKYISESFQWDPQQSSPQKVNQFIEYFLVDLLYENQIEVTKQYLEQLIEQSRIQLRSQALYKSLLKKHSNILLSFSTMEVSQDIKEYLIEIQLKLANQDGQIFFQDSFQWDLLNQSNNVQDFCKTLIEDENIPSKYLSEISYKIKSQINAQLQWKFTMLAKTFKSIHKDRQSPKLNTQTLTQLKKNIIYSMDVGLPNNPDSSKVSPFMYLNNSDLFSTLSRNFDILPEQFQQILQSKQIVKANEMNINQKVITKTEADQGLKSKNFRLQQNKYIGNFTNTYKMHNIWKSAVDHDVKK